MSELVLFFFFVVVSLFRFSSVTLPRPIKQITHMQTEYLSNDVPRAGQRCEAAPKLNKRRFDQRDNEVR